MYALCVCVYAQQVYVFVCARACMCLCMCVCARVCVCVLGGYVTYFTLMPSKVLARSKWLSHTRRPTDY